MHGTAAPPDEIAAYLARAKAAGFREKILAAFERADKLKIVFVGETIIDEYRYVLPLPKPSKEFIIAGVTSRELEFFAGGVIAAALHGDWANFRIATQSSPGIGEEDRAIVKTRFVDDAFNRKLFEVYSRTVLDLSVDGRNEYRRSLSYAVKDADVLVVFDFGHGLLGEAERRILVNAKFLAVNAQTNAGNFGFNPVTNYKYPELTCVDEPEARLATGMQRDDIGDVAVYLSKKMAGRDVIVTMGCSGCIVMTDLMSKIPSFSTKLIDTMGAGDAFLAVSAPLVAAGLELEAAAFVGNIAGAIKVGIVGHRRHVGRQEILQKINELLA